MKTKFFGFILAASVSLFATANADTFVNGGFENGNLTGWTGGGGSWHGSPAYPVAPSHYAGGTPNNTVVGVGVDPISGLNRVYNGSYAVRVNDSLNNYSVSTLTNRSQTTPTITSSLLGKQSLRLRTAQLIQIISH